MNTGKFQCSAVGSPFFGTKIFIPITSNRFSFAYPESLILLLLLLPFTLAEVNARLLALVAFGTGTARVFGCGSTRLGMTRMGWITSSTCGRSTISGSNKSER